MPLVHYFFFFFFLNDTATTEIYTLPLHDALPISIERAAPLHLRHEMADIVRRVGIAEHVPVEQHEPVAGPEKLRSEEHTSELQSPCNLVCRLLLEKKKTNNYNRKIVPTPLVNFQL